MEIIRGKSPHNIELNDQPKIRNTKSKVVAVISAFRSTVNTNRFSAVFPDPIKEFQLIVYKLS